MHRVQVDVISVMTILRLVKVRVGVSDDVEIDDVG